MVAKRWVSGALIFGAVAPKVGAGGTAPRAVQARNALVSASGSSTQKVLPSPSVES